MFDWSAEFNRVLKKGGNFAIFCADAYISFFMDALKANGLSPRRVISWTKPNAVSVNRAYMPTSAVEYIIVGVKGGKATFNADVEIVEQQLDSKLVEAVIVAEKTASIVNSLTRQAILEMVNPSGEGEVGTAKAETGVGPDEKAGVGESQTGVGETGVYAEESENHVKQILDTVKQTLQGKEDIILDRVENMYKTKNGVKYLQACVPNHVAFPLKTGNRIHPTEKPVALLQYLLALYSKEGDTVLDAFAGSGSTGEACLTLSRIPLLIEREKEFYDKAKLRLGKSLYL